MTAHTYGRGRSDNVQKKEEEEKQTAVREKRKEI